MRKPKKSNRELPERDFPEGIMLEILVRLPSESILTLKCVSPEWKQVIDDPNFLKHYGVNKTITFPAADEFHCLSLVTNKTITDAQYPPFSVRRVPWPAVSPNEHLFIKTVCNDMACYSRFTNIRRFVFYNLITGVSHKLIDAPLLYYPWLCYGFGYNSVDYDYKMMVVCKYQAENHGIFWVYSFKATKWVRRFGFPHALYDWNSLEYVQLSIACSFNGKLHWFPVKPKNKPWKAILTYDLGSNRFGEIDTPGDFAFQLPVGNLKDLGGKLSYWVCSSETVDVWVRGDESWTRLVSLNKSRIARQTFINHIMEPVMVYECRDGRKLVLFICHHYESLYWYDVGSEVVVKVIRQSTWRKTRVVGQRQLKACNK